MQSDTCPYSIWYFYGWKYNTFKESSSDKTDYILKSSDLFHRKQNKRILQSQNTSNKFKK